MPYPTVTDPQTVRQLQRKLLKAIKRAPALGVQPAARAHHSPRALTPPSARLRGVAPAQLRDQLRGELGALAHRVVHVPEVLLVARRRVEAQRLARILPGVTEAVH